MLPGWRRKRGAPQRDQRRDAAGACTDQRDEELEPGPRRRRRRRRAGAELASERVEPPAHLGDLAQRRLAAVDPQVVRLPFVERVLEVVRLRGRRPRSFVAVVHRPILPAPPSCVAPAC